MGFTRPRAGQPSPLFQEFQALLGWESKAVAQIVYEIIAQTVGWHTPLDPAATESWVLLSLRHFEHICIIPPSQVLKGLTLARERGYIVRRPAGRAYEYALHWRDESAHTPQRVDSVSDVLLSESLDIDTSENDVYGNRYTLKQHPEKRVGSRRRTGNMEHRSPRRCIHSIRAKQQEAVTSVNAILQREA